MRRLCLGNVNVTTKETLFEPNLDVDPMAYLPCCDWHSQQDKTKEEKLSKTIDLLRVRKVESIKELVKKDIKLDMLET